MKTVATILDDHLKFEPIRCHYYGLACANCSKPRNDLRSCTQCYRAYYCDANCQRQHWKIHKPTCSFLKNVTMVLRDRPITSCKQRYLNLNFAVQLLNSGKEQILGRYWFLSDRKCSICYKSPFHFGNNARDWFHCPKCNFGWCCSESHWNMYKSNHTPEICLRYQQSIEDELFMKRHHIEYNEEFNYAPQKVFTAVMRSFPTNWDEYYKLRCPVEYSSKNVMSRSFFPCATRLSSQVCTVLYGIDQMGLLSTFNTNATMQLHVIGAAYGFDWPPTCIWEEILHVFPNLKALDACFIGPGVKFSSVDLNTGGDFGELDTCPECSKKRCVRKYSFFSGTYHDYNTSKWFKSPDVCVAFNTGLYQEATESWKQSIEVLLQMNVPCIFTSYNDEGEKDLEIINELEANIVIEPKLNPFRCENYMIDEEDIDKFYQHNAYITCFQGKSNSEAQT